MRISSESSAQLSWRFGQTDKRALDSDSKLKWLWRTPLLLSHEGKKVGQIRKVHRANNKKAPNANNTRILRQKTRRAQSQQYPQFDAEIIGRLEQTGS